MIDYKLCTDEELVIFLREDDHRAFEEIHARYYPVLYRHAYRKLPDREEVRDILQELFGSLWSNKQLSLQHGLKAYLYTAIRNRLINVFSKNRVRDAYAGYLATYLEENTSYETEERLVYKDLIKIIESEVDALPPQMQKIFKLSRYEHLSYLEISKITNTSPETVKKQAHNALKILKKKLHARLFSILV